MIRLRVSIPALYSALALSLTACGNTDAGTPVDTMPTGSGTVSPGTSTGSNTVGPVGTGANTSTGASGASGTSSGSGGASGSSGGSGPATSTGPATTTTTSTGATSTGPGPTGSGTTTTAPTSDAPTSSGTPDTSTTGEETTTSEPVADPLPPDGVVTSAQGAWWTAGALTEGAGAATVTVNDTEVQTWDGFGGAFNERGWSYLTTDAMKQEAIKLLFSSTDGANFAWGRIPMGASDYGVERYTLADTGTDVAPDGTESNRPPVDLELASFSLEQDGEYLIPYIKAAQVEKPDLHFWASPWTPPTWMKTGYLKEKQGTTTPATKPSYFDGGNMNNDPAILAAFAEYFVKFVEGYAEQGINVEVVAPQNEPGYQQNYPSCLWDGATFATFIGQHLGPKMQAMGVKVMLGTLSNAQTDVAVGQAVTGDATAMGFVSMAGVQWGVLDSVNGGTGFSGLPVWATEHKCGNYPWAAGYNGTQAPNDQAYAVESWGYIRDAIKNGKVTSYNSWNMVLDKNGLGNDLSRDWRQNALLVADGGMVNPTPTYYVFRHFSQYVAPGAKVLGAMGEAVGFKNPDGSLVAVVYNAGAANPNYSVGLGGKTFTVNMPAAGWATVKYTP
jgi:glucosylceramidase